MEKNSYAETGTKCCMSISLKTSLLKLIIVFI